MLHDWVNYHSVWLRWASKWVRHHCRDNWSKIRMILQNHTEVFLYFMDLRKRLWRYVSVFAENGSDYRPDSDVAGRNPCAFFTWFVTMFSRARCGNCRHLGYLQQCSNDQYGTMCKRPFLEWTRFSAIYKIMHCYLGLFFCPPFPNVPWTLPFV